MNLDVNPLSDPVARRARRLAVLALTFGLATIIACGIVALGLAIFRPQVTAFGFTPHRSEEHVLELPVQPATPGVASPAPVTSPTPPRASGTPASPPASPSPSPTRPAASLPTATPTPTQYYITCRDGRVIVGTTTQGACAGQGGIESVSATPPNATPAGATPNEAVTFLTVQGTVPGGQASVTVQTRPNESCSIVYTTPTGEESTAAGLNNQAADRTGRATWRWTVPPSTPIGAGKVTVRCGGARAEAVLQIG